MTVVVWIFKEDEKIQNKDTKDGHLELKFKIKTPWADTTRRVSSHQNTSRTEGRYGKKMKKKGCRKTEGIEDLSPINLYKKKQILDDEDHEEHLSPH